MNAPSQPLDSSIETQLSRDAVTVWKKTGRNMRRRLLSGLLVLVPLGITIFTIRFLIQFFAIFIIPMEQILPRETPEWQRNLFALLLFGLVVYFIGFVTQHVFGRRLIAWFESLLLQIPGIKLIYSASKQIVESIASDRQTAFEKVVVFECFYPGYKALGFQTGTSQDSTGRTFCHIFLPTSPNPTSGYLLLVPAENVQVAQMSVEEAFKLIVSAGMLPPPSAFLPPPISSSRMGSPVP